MFFTSYLLCSLRLHILKTEGKYIDRKPQKKYKTEIKILANPGLAS